MIAYGLLIAAFLVLAAFSANAGAENAAVAFLLIAVVLVAAARLTNFGRRG